MPYLATTICTVRNERMGVEAHIFLGSSFKRAGPYHVKIEGLEGREVRPIVAFATLAEAEAWSTAMVA